ncbi:MAG TPA: hypothetical protein VJ987_04790 [Anaerolineales bacterium]|nr:hypothetical protein [Anaerolineales bacterium]
MDENHQVDIEEVKRLIRLMCINFIQMTVKVNWREPRTQNTAGEIYRDGKGVICIDINPKLSTYDLYLTALHECGHYLAGHKLPEFESGTMEIIEKIILERGPYLTVSDDERLQHPKKPIEIEAQSIADQLEKIIENVALAKFDDTGIMALLNAALSIQYFPPKGV